MFRSCIYNMPSSKLSRQKHCLLHYL